MHIFHTQKYMEYIFDLYLMSKRIVHLQKIIKLRRF